MSRAIVVGETAEQRDVVVARLVELGRAAEARSDALGVETLDAGSVVVVLASEELPDIAIEVMRAGHSLVTTAPGPHRGFQPDIEFLHARTPEEAAERANTALVHPDALRMTRVIAGVIARRCHPGGHDG